MPNFLKKLFIICFTFKINAIQAQYGGWASYAFLKLPSDAFTTGLGGQNVAPIYNEPSLFLNNAALGDSIKKQYLKINFAPLWAGTSTSTITYGHHFKKIGVFSASLQYLNYGTFQGTDAAGNITGTFNANDFALVVGHARKVNNISIGLNLKLAGSNIESYSAYAILADFGGYFKHPKKEISYGLSIKNMGARLKNFTDSDTQLLPFDVQMGFSFRPEQMPFRLSVNAHHLHQWEILADKSVLSNLLGNQNTQKEIGFGNRLASHLIFGIEALIHQNFQLNFGYNHLLRNELKQENIFTLSGFSIGFLLKAKRVNFGVAHQGFQAAAGLTQFSFYTPFK
jgi:hypothetical protein